MPLNDGYGVLVGTIHRHYRDPADDYGNWFHVNVEVDTPNGRYRCAIDVDSHQSNTGVEWRSVELAPEELGALLQLPAGFHRLAMDSTSGAIDYIRSRMFAWRVGCLAVVYLVLSWFFPGLRFDISSLWRRGTSDQAAADLEPHLDATRRMGGKVLVFGEPFTRGLGVHNIHQNQGDPERSRWWAENGTWQDGCTILQRPDGKYVAFLNKFTSQSYRTDDQGHPIP